METSPGPATPRHERDELAYVLGVELNQAVRARFQNDTPKYPSEKIRGSSRKYTGE